MIHVLSWLEKLAEFDFINSYGLLLCIVFIVYLALHVE